MSYKLECTKASEGHLALVQIFRGLDAEARRRVAQRCQLRRYAPKTVILESGNLEHEVFFVVRGRVCVTYYSASGREVVFADDQVGDIFGELAGIAARPRSASVLSITETIVAVMKAEQFRQTMSENGEVAKAVLGRLATIIRALEDRVIEFSTLTVEKRVYGELLRLAQGCRAPVKGALIAPVPTHAEIASRVSTHREAVTRVLSDLTRKGLLEKRPGMLVVHDVGALDALARES